MEHTTAEKVYKTAVNLRDVLRYVKKFKNSQIVIQIDDEVIDSPYFPSIIKDICYIHDTGIKVLIVPGAKHKIDRVLKTSHFKWKIENGIRITDPEAMPLIKMAAFDTSNIVMTALAGEGKDALIGNWVKARSTGILDGIDFGTSGEIENIKASAIHQVLEQGFIPIFPCIGWNSTGQAYNILSTSLATELATLLSVEKLFFITADILISNIFETNTKNVLGKNTESVNSEPITAMNLDELIQYKKILTKKQNEIHQNKVACTNSSEAITLSHKLHLLDKAYFACSKEVTRVHIINGFLDGALPCEIFSGIGSGTMIYKSNYGGIRQMNTSDIPDVLNLMRPFIDKGILLDRNAETLLNQIEDFIVYSMDGGIKACAALHQYSDKQAEISAIAVDETISHLGTGPKLVNYLINSAKKHSCTSVFVLTTQTADWFLQLGFTQSTIDSLPEKRKSKWSEKRGSKVFRIQF